MRVFEAAGSGLQNHELLNNAVGAMVFTFNASSATAGMRNHGLGFGTGSSASGLYPLTWPTATVAIGGTTTLTFGEFGTDTARLPIINIIGAASGTANQAVGFPQTISTNGATIQMMMLVKGAGAAAALSIGTATAAFAASLQVFPAVQSMVSGTNFTFNTVTSGFTFT